ncbi:hypothetical protein RMSM_00542 [Rhodopirellula maiorica SM1]|uniref:Uncharacterized protein n=1 Tax=Rhodopirellula maiorica SM1 TaxID=1265738 RepID=M5S4E5_9BACT|nr:hypothetical protein RMSM_00542 [Rhodopirellula maiorica SM1]
MLGVLHRRSGVAKLGHHNVNRRIAVTSTVLPIESVYVTSTFS